MTHDDAYIKHAVACPVALSPQSRLSLLVLRVGSINEHEPQFRTTSWSALCDVENGRRGTKQTKLMQWELCSASKASLILLPGICVDLGASGLHFCLR